MPLLQELANTVVSYTIQQTIVLSLLTTISGIGAFTILFLLITNARKLDTPSTLLIYSQLSADFCLCLNILVMTFVNCLEMKWVWGPTGCLVNSIFTVSSCYTSILSLLAISIERYYSAALSRPFTKLQIKMMMIAIWVISWLLVGPMSIYTQTYPTTIALHKSLFYCSIAWHTNQFMTTFLMFTSATILFVTLSTIVFSYYHLIKLYMHATRIADDAVFTESIAVGVVDQKERVEPPLQAKLTEREKELVLKAVVMASAFIIFWTPFFTKILIEFNTKEPVSWLFDTVCCAFILTHCASSPVIVYVMDHRIRRNVKSYFSFNCSAFK